LLYSASKKTKTNKTKMEDGFFIILLLFF